MEQAGLHGMKYDDTQPPVRNDKQFDGVTVGILVSHCFEDVQLYFPHQYFSDRGARVHVITPDWIPQQSGGLVAACEFVTPTAFVSVQKTLSEAIHSATGYDILIIPGGIWSSTVLRNDESAIKLNQLLRQKGRLIGFICTGVGLAIQAGLATNSTLTGSPAIRVDLINAGAKYLGDMQVVRDKQRRIVFGRDSAGQGTRAFTQALAQAFHRW